MTKQTYGLDVEKINTIEDVKIILNGMNLVGYFDPEDPEDKNYNLREYFTILQEPQKLEEKIDVLIAKTIAKFECSKETAEYYYNERFDRIFSNFHYAKEHGHFPIVRIAKTGRIDYSKLSVSGGYNIGSPSFVVKQGETRDGYYTFGNRKYFKYYIPDKPNFVNRFCMDKLLGFKWVDEKK